MILVTGGCGYIGSHFIVKLIEQGINVISLDNFSNSSHDTIDKIRSITNSNFNFIEGDVRDIDVLEKIFSENDISSVVHFAGLKSVKESFERPLDYYSSNITGSINLFKAMNRSDVNKIIFSSSATVYGDLYPLPWHEELSLQMPISPYAQTKFIVEEILKMHSFINLNMSIGILRYFNPIGSHVSGLIGDNINNKDGNLIPSIIRVLQGQSDYLSIFGNDYSTLDGTGVRDYLHIDDLLDGHIKALNFIELNKGFNIWNLGTGRGYSVLEILREFEKLVGKSIPYKFKNRRKGDLPEYWAEVSKSEKELEWTAKNGIEQMVKDSLNYINHNQIG